MASPPAVVRLLVELGEVLGARGLPWYVFGAQAAAAYGRPRMTADVDVTVGLGRASKARLLAELERAGFPTRLSLSSTFVREARLFPLVHASTLIPVDLLVAGPGLHQAFLARRQLVDVGVARIPMLCPEDLIVTKILAGRRKDLEDVRGVLLEQGDALSIDGVRALLGDVERALERPGLVRRFDRLRRTRGRAGGG